MARTNETSAPLENVAALRQDLLEVCRYQHENVKDQQGIRDRWFRSYFTASVALLSLLGVFLALQAALPRDSSANPKASAGVNQEVLTSIGLGVFAFVGILGLIFLVIYVFQSVNYHIHYLGIARTHECLRMIHETTLIQLQLPNPFVYSYGRYQSLSLDNPALGTTRIGRLMAILRDPRLWGADCCANGVHILFVSVSAGGCVACTGVAAGIALMVAMLSFCVLAVFRQFGMALLLSLATKDFETRWSTRS